MARFRGFTEKMSDRLGLSLSHFRSLAASRANSRKPQAVRDSRRRLRIDSLEDRRMLAVVLPDLPNVQQPRDNPALPAAFDTFTPPVSAGTPSAAAPQFAEALRTAGPGDTLTVSANQLSTASGADYGDDSQFLVYGQTQAGNGTLASGQIQQISATGAAVTIPTSEPANSMYLVWAENASGASLPIAVNRTEAWWVGTSTINAGSIGSIYGQNLTQTGAATPTSYVYLQPTNGTKGQWLTVTNANPYKVDFQVPAGLANGTYQLWANNGEGGRYGWAAPVTITVVSPWTRNGHVYNVKNYGALGNGVADDTAAIMAADRAAQADQGSTLYFPAGTYMISAGFSAPVNIDWAGAGMNSSIIRLNANFKSDQVIGGAAHWAQFSNLTFDANFDMNGVSPSKTMFLLAGSNDLKFTDVKFIAQTPDSQVATSGAYSPISINNGSDIRFEGCDFVESSAVFVGIATQLSFDNCTFEGVSDASSLILTWGGQQISVTNCTAEDHNNAVADGWAEGRFFVQQGMWGVSSQIYLGNNKTVALAPRNEGENGGEQVLFENSAPSFQNTPNAVTSNTAVLPGSADTEYEQGTVFTTSVAGSVIAIRFYKAVGETTSHTGHLWDSKGNLLATVTFPPESSTGWQIATLSNPVTLAVNTQYVVSVNINSHYVTKSSATLGTVKNGPLTFVQGVTSDPNVFPSQATGNTYFVDVRFTPNGTTIFSTLFTATTATNLVSTADAVNLVGDFAQIVAGTGTGEQRKIIGFDPVTQTLTVSPPWSVLPNATSHIEINQAVTQVAIYDNSFSGKTANVQADLTQGIASAQIGVDFWNDATGVVVADNQFTNLLRAVGTSGQQYGTNLVSVANFNLVTGNTLTNVVNGFSFNDWDTVSHVSQPPLSYGTAMIGNVFRDNTMNTIAGDAFDDLSSGNPSAYGFAIDDFTVFEHNLGTNVHVVAALNQGLANRHSNTLLYANSFAPGSMASASSFAVDLGAGSTQPALLLANNLLSYAVPYRQSPAQTAVALPERTVSLVAQTSSSPATASVSLENGSAGALNWTATSDSSWLTVTSSGSVPSQAAAGQLTVTANPAGLSAGTYTATVRVSGTSIVAGPSLFAGLVPLVGNQADGRSYELATKIHSTQSIHVTAIRFYKASAESGTHVGTLWDATGHMLAQVTFTNETASGWQTATLSTPVDLAANADYYVGTNINKNYVDSSLSTLGSIASNGLTVTGGYSGPTGLLPTANTAKAYFVDLVFSTTTPAETESITISLTVPAAVNSVVVAPTWTPNQVVLAGSPASSPAATSGGSQPSAASSATLASGLQTFYSQLGSSSGVTAQDSSVESQLDVEPNVNDLALASLSDDDLTGLSS
jgi:hypothetical protein